MTAIPLASPGASAPTPNAVESVKLYSPFKAQSYGMIPEDPWSAPSLLDRAKVALGGLTILAGGARDYVHTSYAKLGVQCGRDPRTVRKGVAELVNAGWLEIEELGKNFGFRFRFLYQLRGDKRALNPSSSQASSAHAVQHSVRETAVPPGPPYKEERREKREEKAAASIASTPPRENEAEGPPPPVRQPSSSEPEPPKAVEGRESPDQKLVERVKARWPQTPNVEAKLAELNRVKGLGFARLALAFAHHRGARDLVYALRTCQRWQKERYSESDARAEVEGAKSESRSQRKPKPPEPIFVPPPKFGRRPS